MDGHDDLAPGLGPGTALRMALGKVSDQVSYKVSDCSWLPPILLSILV